MLSSRLEHIRGCLVEDVRDGRVRRARRRTMGTRPIEANRMETLEQRLLLASDPIGYWSFDNATNVGEDSGPNGSNLFSVGGATHTADGKSGGGLSLDGINDYLVGLPSQLPTGDSPYTISSWLKADATGARGIVGWGSYGQSRRVNALRLFNDNGFRHYWWGADLDASDGQVAGKGVNLDEGAWHHIVARYDGVDRELWLNGELLVSDIPGANNSTAANFRIGSTNNGEYFDGTLDDVAIWDVALEDSEVMALANGTSPLQLDGSGLLAHWLADDLDASLDTDDPVVSWVDSIGGVAANASFGSPIFEEGAINSHAVVRFDPGDGADQLLVDAVESPLSGIEDFTVAVVFRAPVAGVGGEFQWTENSGIVDASSDLAGTDFGLGINSGGQVGAGLGNPDFTAYSDGGQDDGFAHVAILSRSGGETRLYVDGGDGFIGVGGTSALLTTDLTFGSLASSTNFFSGDIAEIQVYGSAFDTDEAFALASELGNAYEIAIESPTVESGAELVAQFVADDMPGGTVGTWTSRIGGATATVLESDPTTVQGVLNGHSVVRFDGNDALGIAAAENPFAGARDFSLVTIFQTDTAGEAGANWFENSGLVDMNLPGDAADWGLAIDDQGFLVAGMGSPVSGNIGVSTTSGQDDGRLHVAVFTRAAGTITLYVDGVNEGSSSLGDVLDRETGDVAIGRILSGGGFFTGDIAEVRFYDNDLTGDEVATLSEELQSNYAATSLNYIDQVLDDNPDTYLRLGEGSNGVPAVDEAGGDNNGVYNGSPVVGVEGAIGTDTDTAVRFDGVNDHVVIDNTTGLDFTIEFWMKSSAPTPFGAQAYQGNGLAWSDVGGGANDFVIAAMNNRVTFFEGGTVNSTVHGLSTVNNGEWHHVVATRKAGELRRLYVDGVEERTGAAGTGLLNANPNIVIGANTLDGRFFDGEIDEFALYNRVLTPAEVLAHYEAGIAEGLAPTAIPDQYNATEETLLTVGVEEGVLENDTSNEGLPLTAVLLNDVDHGTLNLSPDGSFTYLPDPNFAGVDSFTYKAQDAQDSVTTLVTITVANTFDPATAVPDAYLVARDETLAVSAGAGVLENDTNPDNAAVFNAVLGDDVDHGTLNLAADGSFDYEPNGGFSGTDTFTYTIFDGTQNSNEVTVTITVDPRPEASDDLSYVMNEDDTLNVSAGSGVLNNDVDDDSLTAILVNDVSSGMLTLNGDGSFSYEPNEDFSGTDEFTYFATDGELDSSPATVRITVNAVNDPPIGVTDQYFAFEDQNLNVSVGQGLLANDIDVDNSSLTVELLSQPAVGTGTVSMNDDGSFTYSPPAGFVGSTSFEYRVFDGLAHSDTTAVSVVVNSRDAQVVINEINYDPPDNTVPAEFVELYNAGQTPVDLSGWFFSSGIELTIPNGTVMAPDSYLLVAADPATIQSVYGKSAIGPWVGKLSNDGDHLILRNAVGDKVDEVDYGVGYPWPIGPAGDGGSMELIHPSLDNDLGGSWRVSTTSSTLPQQPVTLLGAADTGWSVRKGTNVLGEPSNPVDAWRQPEFVEDGTWIQNRQTPVGYGDNDDNYLLDDMQGNYSTVYLRNTFDIGPEVPELIRLRVYVDDGAIIYINGAEIDRFNMDGADKAFNSFTGQNAVGNASWVDVTYINPEQFFTPGINTIAIHSINATLGSSDLSIDIEVVIPGASDALAEPSPGEKNSAFATNTAPQTRQVKHGPNEPVAGEDVVLTIKATDPDGVASVNLEYQVVLPGSYIPAFIPVPINTLISNASTPTTPNPAYFDPANWTTVVMVDDGTGADEVAGDNIYTAVIPGQINRSLVRYRMTVEDTLGESVTVPYADDPSLNFAYFVYDGVPDYQGISSEILESLPVYQFLTRAEDMSTVLAYSSTEIPQGTQARFAYNWPGTMVYDGEVYDNIKYRLRGANGRYHLDGKRSMRFRFNKGSYFQAHDNDGNKLPEKFRTLTTGKGFDNRGTLTWGLNEAVSMHLFNEIGVPGSETYWFHFRVIDGVDEAPNQWNGDFWGTNFVLETYDVRFLESHDLEKGNLYKLINQTTNWEQQQRYQAPNAVTDGSDHNNIENNLDGFDTAAHIDAHVNLEKWNLFHALAEAIRHYDFWPSANKNMVYYFEPDYLPENSNRGKLWILPWDTDASWGPTWNSGHDVVYNALFPAGGGGSDSGSTPELWPAYFNTVRELRDLLWQPDQIEPLIDEFADVIRDFIPADEMRWKGAPFNSGSYNGLGGAGSISFDNLVQDMKNFAFSGGSWPGGGVGAGGRAAHLDVLQGSNGEGGQIPNTPTLSYVGDVNFPTNGLRLRSSSFSDPQGSGTFGAVEFRVAEVTDSNAPNFDPEAKFLLEWNADWESGELMTWDFNDAIDIPASAIKVGSSYRARVRVMDNSGRWSHWSDAVSFIATQPNNVDALLDDLRITEIHYNPADAPVNQGFSNSDFEFIELRNTGISTLDLTDVLISGGIEFDFTGSDVTTLDAGEFVVVVGDAAAFDLRYETAGINVAGVFGSSLSNGGEDITLSFGADTIIQQFDYDDDGDWPERADGSGFSLEIKDTSLDYSDGDSWRSSREYHGTPGFIGSGPIDSIVINEVLTHTDLPLTDSIELFNPTGLPIDLSGWVLSDSDEEYEKFEFPDGFVIPAGGYAVLTEADFNSGGSLIDFALSSAKGDEVWLMERDGSGVITNYVDHVRFGGALNGESFGRWPNGIGDLYPMVSRTFGGVNSGPRVGPLIISEVHFHPATPTAGELAALPGVTAEDFEFIEIANPTGAAVDLENWRVRGGIDFDFAAGTVIEPNGVLVLVDFDPTDVANNTLLGLFRSRYEIDGSVELVGGFSGKLDNEGESVRLERPDSPPADDPDFIPHVLEDAFRYNQVAPWPTNNSGTGNSLQRKAVTSWGNDPASWSGLAATPGSVDFGVTPNVDVHLVPRILGSGVSLSGSLPVSDNDPVTGGGGTPFYQREGNMFMVEVWVKSDQLASPGSVVETGSITLTFDSAFAEYLAVDHGDVFNEVGTTFETFTSAGSSSTLAFGGSTNLTGVGDDEFALLGRVMFKANAPIDAAGSVFGPFDTGINAIAGPSSFELGGGLGAATADVQSAPVVETRAVIYDFDNNGIVNFADLGLFLPAMGLVSGGSQPPYTNWGDFDNDGQVDEDDLDLLLGAFAKPFDGPLDIPTSAKSESGGGGGGDSEVDLLEEAGAI